MNNPLTKEELQQMVQDAGKPVVVWLHSRICTACSNWAMFDGAVFTDGKGDRRSLECYHDCGYDAYPDKPAGPLTLTGDEQATLRHICKVYPWARYITISAGYPLILNKEAVVMVKFPSAFFKTIPEDTRWKILIGEDGTVTLEAAE